MQRERSGALFSGCWTKRGNAMATAALVDRDIEIGRRIVASLTRAEIPVTICFWAFVSEQWLFIVATPLVDSKGPLAAYDKVNRALQNTGLPDEVALQRIFLISPNDRELKALQKQNRIAPYEAIRTVNASIAGRFVEDAYVYSGSLDVLKREPAPGRMGPRYDVVYFPYSGQGSAPAVPLEGEKQLMDFLEKVGIRREVVERTLRAVAKEGDATIPNVQLKHSELKRLGLA